MNVHFICRGNVLRSLIAETYLKSKKLKNVTVISSGTNVNWNDEQEREYFANTLALLDRRGIGVFAKTMPDQLTQSRLDSSRDVVILLNQRVADEARGIVSLTEDTTIWEVVDIGEGDRTNQAEHISYEEEIYQEITKKIDDIFTT